MSGDTKANGNGSGSGNGAAAGAGSVGSAGGPPMLVRQSSVEQALALYGDAARDVIVSVQQKEKEQAQGKGIPALHGCIFVGHNNTDMDSVGSAIGAAELFGGVALKASPVNSETKFALDAWGVKEPELFSDVGSSGELARRAVCLLDHNQLSQTPPGLDVKRVRGIIDHHAIQSGVVTSDTPIHVDIRPWGSTCTIIAQLFVDANRSIAKQTAGILLCGILSDTLNCQSPTTTEYDRLMVSILARMAGVTDINALAQRLFKAKSKQLLSMGPHAVLRGDLKRFDIASAKGGRFLVAFGVVETVDLPTLMTMRDGLLEELKALKGELIDEEHEKAKKAGAKGAATGAAATPLVFLALVDINAIRGELLCATTQEQRLGEAVYGGAMSAATRVLGLGTRVSRKKDFLPPLSKTLESGWLAPPLTAKEEKELSDGFGEVELSCSDHGCILKRKPMSLKKAAKLVGFVSAFKKSGGLAAAANAAAASTAAATATATCGAGHDHAGHSH